MRPKFEQMGLGERRLVALLAFVQFVNILDFMMVMPLGPDFSADLGIPTSKLGIVGGSYTAAAAVSGLVSAMILDRFPRKKALITAVTGLSLATFAGALSNGLTSLLAARVCQPFNISRRPPVHSFLRVCSHRTRMANSSAWRPLPGSPSLSPCASRR